MTILSLVVMTTLMFVVLFVWVALMIVMISLATRLFYWLEKMEKVREEMK